jgi:hypothetical protein
MTQPQIRNNVGVIQRSSSLAGIPRAPLTLKISSNLTVVLLTTNQTYLIPPNTYNTVEVEAWGAGGGHTNFFSYGGGGASGAMCAKTFQCSTGLSILMAMGAGGAPGAAGGATTFTVNGMIYTANGGNPGAVAGTTGGAAPTATGGDVNNPGRAGGNGDGATQAGGGGGAPASRRLPQGADGWGVGAGIGGAGPGREARSIGPSTANGYVLAGNNGVWFGLTIGHGAPPSGGYGGSGGFPAGGGGANQNASNGGAGGANGAILLWLYA